MSFNTFLRRASSSLIGSLSPVYFKNRVLGHVIGVQFSTSHVRFLTGIVDIDSITKGAAEETFRKISTEDALKGLSFDLKDGTGFETGGLTLIKKCKDEIIEVKVRPYYEKYTDYLMTRDEELEEVLNLFEDDGKWADTKKVNQREIECLYIVLKIYYGDEFKKRQRFFLVAYPKRTYIRSMSTRIVGGGASHLDDFDNIFKRMGLEPKNINCLFNQFEKKKINE